MKPNIINDGRRAYEEGKSFINNPYKLWTDEENYYLWSSGWWELHDKELEKDREQISKEIEDINKKEAEEQIIKEKKKTKKGRSELAGQRSMF